MTPPCLCNHPRHWHLLQSGVCIDGCTCVEFVEDREPHETVLKSPQPTSNNYPVDGRYATPKGGFDVS